MSQLIWVDQIYLGDGKSAILNSGAEDMVYHYRINSGMILVGVAGSGSNASIAVGSLTTAAVSELLKKFEAEFKCKLSEIKFKMVGSSKLIETYSKAISAANSSVAATVIRNSKFEVFHLLEGAKLRVEKEAIPHQALNSSEIKKVLIVDDSATIRNLLSTVFGRDPYLQVVAMAEKPSQVDALIQKHKPDVITLDIHMPEMDGVTLLKEIFPKYKIPTVMISSISMEESDQVLTALEVGAVDYIQKPNLKDLDAMAPLIIDRVKGAASAKIVKSKKVSASKSSFSIKEMNLDRLIVIGSSTGGTEALREVLTNMPETIPPILIVQHIPPVFSLAFAKRLHELCKFEVKEAEDGDEVRSNRVLIAPGAKQMKVVKVGTGLRVKITDDAPVNRHKPSVDYMFDSVAELKWPNVVGVILTGMGADGAKGLLKLRQLGARTIAQDQETCVVWGMPREATQMGASELELPLHDIAEKLVQLCREEIKIKKVS
jgi:two-component system, chemotaxis family, protein-glutamate methylesterase/glutaminase